MTRKEAYEIGRNLALREVGLVKEAGLGHLAGYGALGGGVLGGIMGGDIGSVAKGALAGGAAGAGAGYASRAIPEMLKADKRKHILEILRMLKGEKLQMAGTKYYGRHLDSMRRYEKALANLAAPSGTIPGIGGGVAGGLGGLGVGALVS